jgi:hypothetical protein
MLHESWKAAVRDERLREVLLGYLQAAGCPRWPGTDGLMLEDALRSYPANAAAGRVPDRQELLRMHPELSEALVAFFADVDGAGPSADP